MSAPDHDADAPITRMLQDVGAGRAAPEDGLLSAVYQQLRAVAENRLGRERVGHSLQATELVHEAWMRLEDGAEWENRAHYFGAAARAMQRILIEHARRRGRLKRGGDAKRLPLSVLDLAAEAGLDEVEALNEALERLEARDPRMMEIVRLRFFAGLSTAETAEVMGLGERTVRRDWTMARAWLSRELGQD